MMLKRYQSILALVLAVVTTFLVSCSSPTATKAPPTYTSTQLEQIQKYASTIDGFRDRITELNNLIQNQEWIEVGSLIHGPLGTLRQEMAYLTRNLLPSAQPAARKAAKDVFCHLEAIDAAAQDNNYQKARDNYKEALKDFDAFLRQIPETNS
ncbi:MAG TPA: photosystem II protein PsbQ [Cyanobacteria bacterium UBA12227]|nr:photosystem II protein PsbQ [Cyanobacteria bacterium UBA12227]HAX85353.1 photosystem II protein PsbQ [Cyanobacteria bacterium UBA11370]HBY79071.1 photosystem II protein PsbQ [Cyanobacteria bacterium UBA11148]